FLVGKVDLDAAGARVDIDVEVVLAAHVRAGPSHVGTLAAGRRTPVRLLRVEQRADPQLLLGQALHRDGLGPTATAQRWNGLAGDRHDLGGVENGGIGGGVHGMGPRWCVKKRYGWVEGRSDPGPGSNGGERGVSSRIDEAEGLGASE